MPVSLRPPEGCAGASIGPLELELDENGIVTVPDGIDYSELLNHGFTPCTDSDLVPLRLKAQQEEEARIEAEVERRVQERIKGNALFGKPQEKPVVAAPAPDAKGIESDVVAPSSTATTEAEADKTGQPDQAPSAAGKKSK